MICAAKWGVTDQGPQEKAFQGKVIRTNFTGDYPSIIEKYEIAKKIYRGLWKARGDDYYYEKLGTGWANRFIGWALSYRNAYNMPDIIWSICTSNMNGFVAGRLLSQALNCKFVLEFQDPPSSKNESLTPVLENELVKCIDSSDGIVTTSNSYGYFLTEKYGCATKKIKTLYLSFPGSAIMKPKAEMKTQNSILSLLHAGSLKTGGGRNARGVVYAIEMAYKKRPDICDKLKLIMIGGGNGADEVQCLARKLNIANSVESHPEVPLNIVLNKMDEADILLVIKFESKKFDMQIPGKMFQYLQKQKPVLGIMGTETEAAKILVRSGIGIVCPNHDVDKLCEILISFYDNKVSLAKKYVPDVKYINEFSSEKMAYECDLFLRSL